MPAKVVATDPQIAHMLSHRGLSRIVENLCITSASLTRNGRVRVSLRLYARRDLPTMKFQLSQLP
jgi:hypothetical protein